MEKRVYLVTGASGFLGGSICRQLVERGESVRAFVLPDDKAAAYLPANVTICYGDLCDKKSLEEFFHVPSATKS